MTNDEWTQRKHSTFSAGRIGALFAFYFGSVNSRDRKSEFQVSVGKGQPGRKGQKGLKSRNVFAGVLDILSWPIALLRSLTILLVWVSTNIAGPSGPKTSGTTAFFSISIGVHS